MPMAAHHKVSTRADPCPRLSRHCGAHELPQRTEAEHRLGLVPTASTTPGVARLGLAGACRRWGGHARLRGLRVVLARFRRVCRAPSPRGCCRSRARVARTDTDPSHPLAAGLRHSATTLADPRHRAGVHGPSDLVLVGGIANALTSRGRSAWRVRNHAAHAVAVLLGPRLDPAAKVFGDVEIAVEWRVDVHVLEQVASRTCHRRQSGQPAWSAHGRHLVRAAHAAEPTRGHAAQREVRPCP